MDHKFDTFVIEYLQEILCEAENDHTLALILKTRPKQHKRDQLKLPSQSIVSEIQLQDCAVSLSISQSHL